MAQHVIAEVEIAPRSEPRQVAGDVAPAFEQQPVPVLQGPARQVEAGRVREMRRAEKLALQVVSPAVERTDDVLRVALAVQHQRLAVAADVRDELDPLCAAHQRLGMIAPGNGVVVADLGHHELVADIARTVLKQNALLLGEELGVEIRRNRKLREGSREFARCGKFDHGPWFSVRRMLAHPGQPNNRALAIGLQRSHCFAKSAATVVVTGRVVNP